MKKLIVITAFWLLALPFISKAQVAVKTDVLNDALLNANLGIEVPISKKMSFDLSSALNSWKVESDKTWKHWLVQPEVRYWLCAPLGGHFFGAHLLTGQYNFGGFDFPVNFLGTDFNVFKNERHQGWFYGLGLAYGYTWMLGKHWNIETEVGIGYVRTKYDTYQCEGCGKRVKDNQHHNYYGPTKVAINISYIFK